MAAAEAEAEAEADGGGRQWPGAPEGEIKFLASRDTFAGARRGPPASAIGQPARPQQQQVASLCESQSSGGILIFQQPQGLEWRRNDDF